MAYEEVNPGLPDVWTHDKEGDFIEGIYLKMKDNVGKNKANMYVLDVDGKKMSVWGTTVLDNKMEDVSIGSKIKITFEGKDQDKEYKNYKVEEDKMAEQETVEPKTSEEETSEESSEEDKD